MTHLDGAALWRKAFGGAYTGTDGVTQWLTDVDQSEGGGLTARYGTILTPAWIRAAVDLRSQASEAERAALAAYGTSMILNVGTALVPASPARNARSYPDFYSPTPDTLRREAYFGRTARGVEVFFRGASIGAFTGKGSPSRALAAFNAECARRNDTPTLYWIDVEAAWPIDPKTGAEIRRHEGATLLRVRFPGGSNTTEIIDRVLAQSAMPVQESRKEGPDYVVTIAASDWAWRDYAIDVEWSTRGTNVSQELHRAWRRLTNDIADTAPGHMTLFPKDGVTQADLQNAVPAKLTGLWHFAPEVSSTMDYLDLDRSQATQNVDRSASIFTGKPSRCGPARSKEVADVSMPLQDFMRGQGYASAVEAVATAHDSGLRLDRGPSSLFGRARTNVTLADALVTAESEPDILSVRGPEDLMRASMGPPAYSRTHTTPDGPMYSNHPPARSQVDFAALLPDRFQRALEQIRERMEGVEALVGHTSLSEEHLRLARDARDALGTLRKALIGDWDGKQGMPARCGPARSRRGEYDDEDLDDDTEASKDERDFEDDELDSADPDQDTIDQNAAVQDARGGGVSLTIEGRYIDTYLEDPEPKAGRRAPKKWHSAMENALVGFNAWCKKNNYYPTLYWISDHGNAWPIDPATGEEFKRPARSKKGLPGLQRPHWRAHAPKGKPTNPGPAPVIPPFRWGRTPPTPDEVVNAFSRWLWDRAAWFEREGNEGDPETLRMTAREIEADQEGILASLHAGSYDSSEYNYYVISMTHPNRIYAGNEFRDDAQEALQDLPSIEGGYRVFTRQYLLSKGINPTLNSSWAVFDTTLALSKHTGQLAHSRKSKSQSYDPGPAPRLPTYNWGPNPPSHDQLADAFVHWLWGVGRWRAQTYGDQDNVADEILTIARSFDVPNLLDFVRAPQAPWRQGTRDKTYRYFVVVPPPGEAVGRRPGPGSRILLGVDELSELPPEDDQSYSGITRSYLKELGMDPNNDDHWVPALAHSRRGGNDDNLQRKIHAKKKLHGHHGFDRAWTHFVWIPTAHKLVRGGYSQEDAQDILDDLVGADLGIYAVINKPLAIKTRCSPLVPSSWATADEWGQIIKQAGGEPDAGPYSGPRVPPSAATLAAFAKARQHVPVASRASHKYDPSKYQFFVVSLTEPRRIHAGNEHQEDAVEALGNLPVSQGPYKVYARRSLKALGLDPDAWARSQRR